MSFQPGFTTSGLMEITKFLSEKNRFRTLDKEDQSPAIKTGCPTLDWMTDCQGIPRGRVIEIAGVESSGKCVTLDTLISIPGEGICTMQEVLTKLNWQKDETNTFTLPNQTTKADFQIYTSQAEPTQVNGAFFAGNTETTVLYTEMGHRLRGTSNHRVLILPENGILRWAHLKDTRPGDLVVSSTGHQVSGPVREICGLRLPSDDRSEPNHEQLIANALLLGTLVTAEKRSGDMNILTTSTKVVKLIQEWAGKALIPEADPFDESLKDFTRFSGIAKIRQGAWSILTTKAINEAPDLIRKSSLEAQKAFVAAALLVKGNWTGSDLEADIADPRVGTVIHAILDNLGIKTICFDSLNTFSEKRKKIAFYDRIAQQKAEKMLWANINLPPSWKKRIVPEQSETHERVQKTLERAAEIYNRGRVSELRESRIDIRSVQNLREMDTLASSPELQISSLRARQEMQLQQEAEFLVHTGEAVPGGITSQDLATAIATLPEMATREQEFGRNLIFPTLIDTEDTDKENLLLVAEQIRPYCRNQTDRRVYDTLILLGQEPVGLERITNTEKGQPAPTADLSVPIGHHYATNTLISHNSTLCMHLCNQELLNNPSAICVYQDYERSTATKYARKMGLHQHHTSLGQPRFHLIPSDSFEEADDYVKAYWKSGIYPSLWVCDSIPAMVPQAMFNRETDDNPQIALQARLLADLLARWVKIAADYGTTFLLINQIRAYISTSFMDKGKAIPGLAGSEKETTPGGNAIKFYASMRLDLRPKSVVQAKSYNPMTGDIENVPIANLVKATTKKNKCGNPYRSGVFYISFGEGIDTVRTMLDLALRKGVIVKEGSGRLNLTLPTGESIIADQAEFINQVKNGPQAKKFQDYLYKALQWDRATEITEEILGLEIEDAETGERSSQGTLTGSATAGKLQLVKAQIDLLMQADALDLLKKSGRAITWTNPNTKEEFRGGNHDSLGKKIKGADRQVLQSQVEAEVKKLEEMLEAAKPKDDAAEAAPSRQNSPPVENSVAALFSAEAEQLNSTSSNNETGNPPFQAEEEPE